MQVTFATRNKEQKLEPMAVVELEVLPRIREHVILRLRDQIDPFAKNENGFFIHYTIVQDVLHDIVYDKNEKIAFGKPAHYATVVVALTWDV